MNVLKTPGNWIFLMVTLAAFLGGLLASLTTLLGFAYGGFESARFDIVAVVVALSTLALFVGMLGVPSHRQVFAVLTLLSSGCLLVVLGLYATGTRGEPLVWTLFLVLIESAAMILSVLKLRQLRTLR
jgi:hypothetical protein